MSVGLQIQLKQLKTQYAEAMTHAENIRKKYEGKAGDMTATEMQEWSNAIDHADSLKSQIVLVEKTKGNLDWANEEPEDQHVLSTIKGATGVIARPTDAQIENIEKVKSDDAYLKQYKNWMRGNAPEPLIKAYQADNPAGGGFAVMPQQLLDQWITLAKDACWIRPLATVFSCVSNESLGAVAIDTDPSDSDWTNELNVGSEETTVALGKRELRPTPLAKYIKVSKKLVRQVANFDDHVLDRLAYRVGITEERAFLSGSGANQPLGVFIADTRGISTARDYTAASSTSFTGDDFIGMHGNLKLQYRSNSSWIINRSVVTIIRKLKDSNNNYLWQPGMNNMPHFVAQGSALAGGFPDMLLGHPIHESEYAPSTVTSGLYTAMLGDWSKYWIADALDMQMQVLYELYALTNQLGFILRKETDGMPVLEEAFTRLKMA